MEAKIRKEAERLSHIKGEDKRIEETEKVLEDVSKKSLDRMPRQAL